MSHVDDGALTAHLDGAGPAGVEEHLRICGECRARLEQLRATRDQARAILRSGGAPAGRRPSFAEIERRHAATTGQRRQMGRLRQLAWAASLVLAIGVGWYAGQLSMNEPAAGRPESSTRLAPAGPESLPAPTPVAAELPSRQPSPAAPRLPVRRAPAETDRTAAGAGAASGAPVTPATPPQDAPRQLAQRDAPDPPVANQALDTASRSMAERAVEARAEREDQALAAAAAPPAALGRAMAATGAGATPPLEWIPIDRTRASAILGRAPLHVPDFEVLGYAERANQPGLVRVTQRLGNDRVLELTEQRGTVAQLATVQQRAGRAAERAAAPAPAPSAAVDVRGEAKAADLTPDAVTVERGGLRVSGRGPISTDSLRVLLGRLR